MEGKGLQPGVVWTILSCTEEEKAEARAFEEDQVAGRLKEDVVSMEGEGECGCGGRLGLPPDLHSSPSSLCSWSREAGCRSRWPRR